MQEDLRINNQSFGKIGGVKSSELCLLELEFYNILEYNLYISNDIFFNYVDEIANCNDN